MTALTNMYDELRAAGHGHRRAVDLLAWRLDLDDATVRRVLSRASRGPESVSALPGAGSSASGGARSDPTHFVKEDL